MGEFLGEYSLPFEAIMIKVREFDESKNPDIKDCKHVVLRQMKRDYRIATLWTIRNQHTQKIHHRTLTLRTIRHLKFRGWEEDSALKITLTDEDGQNEMQKLADFIFSEANISSSGDYFVINLEKLDKKLGEVLKEVSNSERSLVLVSQIVEWISFDKQAQAGLIKLATDNADRAKSLIAALNYGRYSKALAKLREMVVQQGLQERFFQKFLEDNYWMFGSEYSELIDKRQLTLGMQIDFPLRRTVDGYLDIIEIKTPLHGTELFDFDKDHDNLFSSKELSKATSQAEKYLGLLDAEQYRIELREKLRVDKVRARVVIGRDINEQQVRALRSYNADRVRIEVITYDQLIRIAERILEIMVAENPLLESIEV